MIVLAQRIARAAKVVFTSPVLYRYTGARVCPCGYPTLSEDVPRGKLYDAWPATIHEVGLKCGGCGTVTEIRVIACARERGNPTAGHGYLPLDVLEPM